MCDGIRGCSQNEKDEYSSEPKVSCHREVMIDFQTEILHKDYCESRKCAAELQLLSLVFLARNGKYEIGPSYSIVQVRTKSECRSYCS